ncbi:uncharacterized protein SOCE26_062340 [Sorangium cellulosum]|uniref:Uncharacterized protein n=1 Tax=Sorangium cellulosum TaxID=56 RepID=A0A2L0EZR8_SORCE|nr:hypothetical protein [Sorangium cellulosum]AUX44766.1 uncharacterized protein SOCE26_062340 [Sorangium cellulosum]
MLIEVDGSAIEDAAATGKSSAVSRECIENLLLAHHAGKHVVAIGPDPIRVLDPVAGELSRRAQGALRSIRAQWTEIRGLLGRVRWNMRLGLGPMFDGRSVAQARKEILHAHLHDFHDQERLSRSVLLGENLTDAALYLAMGKAFVALHGWRVQIAFEKQGGGGSTTAPCFAALVSDGRIVLAILDSDKKHPGDRIGGTAAKVLSIPKQAFQHVHVLHVRFAENLLSSAVYGQAFTGHSGRLAALARLMQAEARTCAIPWRDHADLKYGLKLFQVRAMAAGAPEEAFWSAAAVALQRDRCQQVRPAPCGKVEECGCYVTDALGRDALELAVAWIEPRDPKRNARLLGIALHTPLGELCEKLLAWGIAPAARR